MLQAVVKNGVPVLPLPVTSCVTLDKLLNLSEAQFSYMQKYNHGNPYIVCFEELNESIYVK